MSTTEDLIVGFHELVEVKRRRGKQTVPAFIGVGAGRAGTTSLYDYFARHSEVYVSPIKEVNYFGVRDKETIPTGLTFSEYTNYFLGAGGEQIVGEFSPAYLTHPKALENMKRYIPNAVLIVTVREPVQRFLSQYKYHQDKHKYTDVNEYTKEALDAYGAKRVKPFAWFSPGKNLHQSMYAQGIKRARRLFGTERTIVTVFENLVATPEKELHRVCGELGVSPESHALREMNASRQQDLSLEEPIRSRLKEVLQEEMDLWKQLVDRQ